MVLSPNKLYCGKEGLEEPHKVDSGDEDKEVEGPRGKLTRRYKADASVACKHSETPIGRPLADRLFAFVGLVENEFYSVVAFLSISSPSSVSMAP